MTDANKLIIKTFLSTFYWNSNFLKKLVLILRFLAILNILSFI